jgi:hypothetical protein
MFDQVMDTFRKATESTLQLQQQMLQQWTQQWSQLAGVTTTRPATPASAPTEAPAVAAAAGQIQSFQKQVATTLTDLLKKHREVLDAQYAAGIRTIEEAFRAGEAKDPAQFLRLTEEFWKHSFDCLRSMAEDQMKGLQAATQKWLETMSKGIPVGGK